MKECCRKYLVGQFGDDPETVDAIYAEYALSVAAKAAEAESALAASEWDALDRAAHTVKGNALSVGDDETAEAGMALRRAAALRDHSAAASAIARIRELERAL